MFGTHISNISKRKPHIQVMWACLKHDISTNSELLYSIANYFQFPESGEANSKLMAVKGYEGLLGYSRVNDAALSYYENKGPNKTDDKDKAMRQNSANVSTKNHNDIIVRAWRLP